MHHPRLTGVGVGIGIGVENNIDQLPIPMPIAAPPGMVFLAYYEAIFSVGHDNSGENCTGSGSIILENTFTTI
jgi:hypothetical protein